MVYFFFSSICDKCNDRGIQIFRRHVHVQYAFIFEDEEGLDDENGPFINVTSHKIMKFPHFTNDGTYIS